MIKGAQRINWSNFKEVKKCNGTRKKRQSTDHNGGHPPFVKGQWDLCEDFYSPRASLLQRAEAGEGLTPDYAIRSAGGVSAGRHDLGNAGRHTWGKDSNADPSHTDPLTIFEHPVKDSGSGSAIHHEWNKRVFFLLTSNCVNRELITVQRALYNTTTWGLCWWGTSCGRALFTASTYVDSSGWQINQLQTYLECYSFRFAFLKLLSQSRTLVTFLWVLRVLTTYFPPELRAYAPLATLILELSWCTGNRKCVTPQLSWRKSVVNREMPGGQRHTCQIKLNSTNNQPVRMYSAPPRFDLAPPINANWDKPSHSFTS